MTWSGENGTPTISDLRAAYDAVIFAIGAGHHKSLKLPILTKEDLEARRSKHTEPVLPQEINTAHTCTAAEIVNWYNGHPGSILPQGLNNDLTDVIIIGYVPQLHLVSPCVWGIIINRYTIDLHR